MNNVKIRLSLSVSPNPTDLLALLVVSRNYDYSNKFRLS